MRRIFGNSPPPAPLVPSFSSVTSAHCLGSNTGTACVNVTNGLPAYTYSWNTVPVQTTQTAIGLAVGTYSVFVKDANGCACVDTITIAALPPMVHTFSPVTNVNCFGSNSGSASLNVSGGTPSYTYSWNCIPVQTTQTAINLYAGTYSVTVTDSFHCSFADTVAITSPTGLTCFSPVISNVKCFGNSDGAATLKVTGGTPGYSYSWNPGAQTNSSATGLVATIYTVTISDNNGCIIKTLVSITQPSQISEIISSDTTICSGTTVMEILSASGGTPGYTYLWSNGASGTSIAVSPSVTTTYSVQITDANGCVRAASNKVNVIPTPSATFQSILDSCTHCLQLNDQSSNAISWQWNFGDGTTSATPNTNHCYKDTGTYRVQLIVNSSPQCKSNSGIILSIHNYEPAPIAPNVFTPNGDGVNDLFRISGLDRCSSYSIKIYNRWGNPVFETDDADVAWNGKTSSGTNAAEGTYYYVLTNQTSTIKGFVMLLR